jgi:hypothetical protein
MVHTTFAASKDEAQEKFEVMKKRLAEICQLIPSLSDLAQEANCENLEKALEAFFYEFW